MEEEEGGDVDGQRLMHEDAEVGTQKRSLMLLVAATD